MKNNNPILFYDGSCAFCSGLVRFVLKQDTDQKLYFAPLEGETFNTLKVPTIDTETIILYSKNQILYKSDAIISILKLLGPDWMVLARFIQIFPKGFRNFIYDIIGKLRYRFAGKVDHTTCPILPQKYQDRILP